MKKAYDIKLLPNRIERRSIPEPMSGCWIWIGATRSENYGVIVINKKNVSAHRASWIAFKSEIPMGMQVCHRCDNPLCVNPDHLFLGTITDNMRDMMKKGRHVVPFGEHHGMSKLTYEAVKEIRTTKTPSKFLAEKFKVTRVTINAIRRGSGWNENNGSQSNFNQQDTTCKSHRRSRAIT